MFTDEQKEKAIALVNEFVAERVEYEESHCDAGDGYAHLPREGDFQYYDGEKRLAAWCAEHDIEGNPDELADIALDNFRMESAHQFHDPQDDFLVSHFPIGEIEIDLNYLVESGAISWELLMEISDDCDAYIAGTGYAFWSSDVAWNAVISVEDMGDAVLATLGEQVTCELCDAYASAADAIHTEDGFTVGECCTSELRVTGYETEHDSEVFYHVN